MAQLTSSRVRRRPRERAEGKQRFGEESEGGSGLSCKAQAGGELGEEAALACKGQAGCDQAKRAACATAEAGKGLV